MSLKNQGTIEIVVALIALFLVGYNVIAGVTLAILALIVFGWLRYKSSKGDDMEGNPLSAEQIQKRRENLDKIMVLAQTTPRLTNNIVQQHLAVSDATAIRYLSYLTDFGKLVRVNDRGKEVYYQLPPK